MAHNLEPQEYLSSANALMQLGGHGDLPPAADGGAGGGAGDGGVVALDAATGLSWPNGCFGRDGREG